ncbi:hypothetical protein [Poriferisphaera corsica]|nr:hypothetical protein [Poriferisphaera corsica]
MHWRKWLAQQIGLPLRMMDGFCDALITEEEFDDFPTSNMELWKAVRNSVADRAIPWAVIDDPLVPLLSHSDCEGRLHWYECKAIAIRLGQILRTIENDTNPILPQRACADGMYAATKRFAVGCMKAYRSREDVLFA